MGEVEVGGAHCNYIMGEVPSASWYKESRFVDRQTNTTENIAFPRAASNVRGW